MDKNDIIEYVMYTPHNTNRAVLSGMLNQLTEGGGGGGGGVGYECTETITTLTEETVTTETGGGVASAELLYSQLIDADTIRVTFNGTEYICSNVTEEDGGVYGAVDGWSTYPFLLESDTTPLGTLTLIATESAGTYTIKIEAVEEAITTTPCFEKAVESVLSVPLRLVPGVTTKAEAVEAFSKGLMMYFINTDNTPNRYEFITTFSPGSGSMNSTPATNILDIGFSEEDDTFYYATR